MLGSGKRPQKGTVLQDACARFDKKAQTVELPIQLKASIGNSNRIACPSYGTTVDWKYMSRGEKAITTCGVQRQHFRMFIARSSSELCGVARQLISFLVLAFYCRPGPCQGQLSTCIQVWRYGEGWPGVVDFGQAGVPPAQASTPSIFYHRKGAMHMALRVLWLPSHFVLYSFARQRPLRIRLTVTLEKSHVITRERNCCVFANFAKDEQHPSCEIVSKTPSVFFVSVANVKRSI